MGALFLFFGVLGRVDGMLFGVVGSLQQNIPSGGFIGLFILGMTGGGKGKATTNFPPDAQPRVIRELPYPFDIG